MTLIEERCVPKIPCESCHVRPFCTAKLAILCPALNEYREISPMERGKEAYRQHLKWMERMCSFHD